MKVNSLHAKNRVQNQKRSACRFTNASFFPTDSFSHYFPASFGSRSFRMGTRKFCPARSEPSAGSPLTSMIASTNSATSSERAVYLEAIVQTLSFLATCTVAKSLLRRYPFPKWNGETIATTRTINSKRASRFPVFFFRFLIALIPCQRLQIFVLRIYVLKTSVLILVSKICFVNSFRTYFLQKFVSFYLIPKCDIIWNNFYRGESV